MNIDNRYKAVFWMVLWAVSFSIAMLYNRFVDKSISIYMTVWMRAVFALLFIAPFVFKEKKAAFKTKHLSLQLFRGLLQTCSILCTYTAYRYLPMPIASSLGMSGPLFLIIFSIIFLKESISLSRWVAIGIGYLGVICIVFFKSPDSAVTLGDFTFNPYMLIALLANILIAGYTVIARILLMKNESKVTTLFYTTLVSSIVYSFVCPFVWMMPSLKDFYYLLIIGGCGAFLQFCYLQAVKIAQPSFLASFEYLRLCSLLFLGWMFLGEVLSSTALFGASLIVVSTLCLLIVDKNKKKVIA